MYSSSPSCNPCGATLGMRQWRWSSGYAGKMISHSLPPHPLILYRRTTSAATLRMLSSSLSPRNTDPSFAVLRPAISKPNSEMSSSTTRVPFLLNSGRGLLNFEEFKCFSTSRKCNPGGAAETGLESVDWPLVVVSFYKFADLPDHADLRKPLKCLCERLRVSGGIILAPEGINGSICGTRDSVEDVLAFIQSDDRLKALRRIESPVTPEEEAIHHGHMSSSPLAAGEDAPFRWDHVRVKLKKEIVTLGMPSVSPIERVGEYVSPKEWNELISDPDMVVIDVRNGYETRIGKFKRAVDPCTTAFREFPSWVDECFKLDKSKNHVDSTISAPTAEEKSFEMDKKMPRVAMYCTGGIRCEKASSLLLSKGFKEVYHLRGGILKYLEDVPKDESLWEGECFVFDKRVSVEHGLVQGTFKLCYGCKQPVSDADMESPEWEYGVSCPYCYMSKSEEEKERARARQRQFEVFGIIGGPDKGRKPTKSQMQTRESEFKDSIQMSSSI